MITFPDYNVMRINDKLVYFTDCVIHYSLQRIVLAEHSKAIVDLLRYYKCRLFYIILRQEIYHRRWCFEFEKFRVKFYQNFYDVLTIF